MFFIWDGRLHADARRVYHRIQPEFAGDESGGYRFGAVLFFLWVLLYATLRRGALANAAYRTMEIPLVVYNLVILLMVISALTTNFRLNWLPAASVLVSCGALLFLFSDVLLAVDRFIRPLPTARLWKRVTYQLGQLAIIAGVLLTFSA